MYRTNDILRPFYIILKPIKNLISCNEIIKCSSFHLYTVRVWTIFVLPKSLKLGVLPIAYYLKNFILVLNLKTIAYRHLRVPVLNRLGYWNFWYSCSMAIPGNVISLDRKISPIYIHGIIKFGNFSQHACNYFAFVIFGVKC